MFLLFTWCFIPFFKTTRPAGHHSSQNTTKSELPRPFEYRNGYLIYRYLSPSPKAPNQLLKEAIASALTFKLTKEVAKSTGKARIYLSSSGRVIKSTSIQKAFPIFSPGDPRTLLGWEVWLTQKKTQDYTIEYPLVKATDSPTLIASILEALYIMTIGSGTVAESTAYINSGSQTHSLSVVHLRSRVFARVTWLRIKFRKNRLKIEARIVTIGPQENNLSPLKKETLLEAYQKLDKLRISRENSDEITVISGKETTTFCITTREPTRVNAACHLKFIKFVLERKSAQVEINIALSYNKEKGSGILSLDKTRITPAGRLPERFEPTKATYIKVSSPSIFAEKVRWKIDP